MREGPHNALITNYGRPNTVDAPLTLIFRMRQIVCHCCFCPSRLPTSHKWMSATNRNINSIGCNANYYWRSIDAYSQNGAVPMLLYLLLINTANTLVMHNSDQITVRLLYLQDHKSLTLHWCSCLKLGGDRVAVSVAYKSCQYISYA